MFTRRSKSQSDLRQALDAFLQTTPQEAPIRRVLASRDIERQLSIFDRVDAAAIRKQKSHRRAGSLALWAGLVGAIVPALALLSVEYRFPAFSPRAINVLRMLSLTLTLLAIMWITVGRPSDRWRWNRATAEAIRAEVFRAILRAGANTAALLPQALACFKIAHLDWQLNYYNSYFKRLANDHAVSVRKALPFKVVGYLLWAGSVLLGAVALVNIAAALGFSVPYLSTVLSWLVLPESDRWQLGLNAMASSILAFAAARSSTHGEIRNLTNYTIAAIELSDIKMADLAGAEVAAVEGRVGDVLAFCDRVQAILTAEHLAWTHAGSLSERDPNP